MEVFKAKYLTDAEILSILDGIIAERDRVEHLLAEPEISTDPELMPKLAKKLYELNDFCGEVEQLRVYMADVQELEQILAAEAEARALAIARGNPPEQESEFQQLHEEYLNLRDQKAQFIYRRLLREGHLEEEQEDETDLKILNFFDYAGAEYAWRLGINVGLDVAQTRERIEKLLEKGLIERVEGTILDGYHRQKSWVKHMNHTYYRISRKGKLYLRELRREDEEVEDGEENMI